MDLNVPLHRRMKTVGCVANADIIDHTQPYARALPTASTGGPLPPHLPGRASVVSFPGPNGRLFSTVEPYLPRPRNYKIDENPLYSPDNESHTSNPSPRIPADPIPIPRQTITPRGTLALLVE